MADPQQKPDSTVEKPRYVKVSEMRPDGDENSCLRPLGLCELGGSCDVCWYSPENRKRRQQRARQQPSNPARR